MTTPPADDKMLYTPVEAAHALGHSRSTLYVLMANGEVPSVRIGSSRRIPVDGLRHYVAVLATTATANHPHSGSNNSQRGVTPGSDDGLLAG
jgi:excisionase family DNA binding protein